MARIFYILILTLFFSQGALAQNQEGDKRLLKASKKVFEKGNYEQALPLLKQYEALYPGNSEVNYRIGVCFYQSEYQKIQAIPYFEKALADADYLIPDHSYKFLAHLYHLDYHFDNAIKMYKLYLKKNPREKKEIKRLISTVENAHELVQDPLPLRIQNIGDNVNSNDSELTPFVSADESVIYFQNKETRDFYKTYNKFDRWQQKIKIDIPNLSQYEIVKFAGTSPDGNQIYIQIGDSSNTDLYYGQNFLKTCSQLTPFNSNINSSAHEGMLSMSPDKSTMYFSSNRKGGYGGFDIYKSEKNDEDQWGPAKNLGPIVNTEQDELYPFIHASLNKLYFSSKGHKTMGGFDIFEIDIMNSELQTVKNLGYPINTTYDDISFSMPAKGNSAYLSSTRSGRSNHYDIYKIYLKESIPLTLVKGKILAGDPPQPINAKIQIIDKVTGETLKYIYNPDPKTGYYLLIFPPGKDYDMIVKAEGYQPYVINIYIPNQSYFYENFQEILLSPINVKSLGETIGEEITITNTFFDIYKNFSDSVKYKQTEKYDRLLELIGNLIHKTDTMGLNAVNEFVLSIDETSTNIGEVKPEVNYDNLFTLVEEALENNDSTTLRILDDNAIPNISYQNRYFYAKDQKKNGLDPVFIASDTIYAIELLSGKEDSLKINAKPKIRYITKCDIYFAKNQIDIDEKYAYRLMELSQLVANNENLYLEINGYANEDEDQQLSISRAMELRSFFTENNLDIERTKTSAILNQLNYGDQGQRTQVIVFESSQPIYEKGKFSSAVKISTPKIDTPDRQKGISYRIQIASGKNKLDFKDEFFKGEKVKLHEFRARYKYTVGSYKSFKKAHKERVRLIEKGFKGAFIVKFKDGIRVD